VVLVIAVIVVHGFQVSRTAQVMLAKAQQAEQEGNKENAIQYYTYYVNYAPKDASAFSRLALLVADRLRGTSHPRQLWEAFTILEKAAQQEPENMEVLRRLADICQKVGRLDDAVSHLTRLREKFPEESALGVQLGECQIRLEKYREALATFEHVIAQDPANLKAYTALADLLREKLQDPNRADSWINQMTARNPKSVKALVERAKYFHRSKQLNAATEDIRRALEMSPQNVEVLVAAAEFAIDNKAYEEAGDYLDRAQALFPDDESVQRARMVLNLSLGKTAEVLEPLEKRIREQQSSDAMDLLTVADLHLKQGDLKKARETIKKMRDAGFREEILDFFEARAEAAEGKWREAVYKLERLRPKVVGWPEFLTHVDLFLGACYEQLRLPDRQLAIYRGLLDRNPSLQPAQAGYAVALFRLGKLDEAAREFAALEKSMGEAEFLQTPALRNALFQLIVARTLQQPETARDWSELEKYVERLSKVEGVDAAQLALMQAEVLSKKGDNAKAQQLIQAQLDKYPKDVGLWTAAIKLAAMLQTPQEALRTAEQARSACGDDVTLRLTIAELAVQLPAEEAAKRLTSLAAGEEGLSEFEKVRLWRGLGACWYRLRDRQKAYAYWQKVAQSSLRDPQIFLVLFELAREGEDEARMTEALEMVKKYLGSRSTEAIYCEASMMVWQAQRGQLDKKALIEAKQRLREAGLERPAWHEIPRLEAEIALLENKPDDAITLLRKASELGPLSPVHAGQLVQLLFARGRYEEAREVINRLGPSVQTFLFLKRIEAEINLRLGDFPQALAKAAEAVQNSNQPGDFLWYGELLVRSRKLDEALAQFRKAVQLDPKIPQGWIALVAVLMETNQKDEALRTIRQAQASLPEDEVPLALAQCYHLVGDLSQAEQYYLTALQQAPENLGVLRATARFYMLTGQSEEAKRYLAQILTLAGRDPEKHRLELAEGRRWLARVLAAEGDWRQVRQALALLDRNAEKGQLPLDDLRLKAAILASRPDRQSRLKAIELLEQIRSEHQKSFSAQEFFALAQLYEQTNQWITAQGMMRELVLKNPKEPQFLAAYVQMMLKHDTPLNAVEFTLAKLEQLAPETPITKILRARVLMKKGQAAEGVQLLKSLLPAQLPPEQVRNLAQLVSVLEEHGQIDAAKQLLQQYAAQQPGAMLVLANFLGKHGTAQEALAWVEKVLPQTPPGALLPVVINILTEQRKKGALSPEVFQKVRPWFVKAAEEAPGSKVVQLHLASLADLQDDYAEQIRLYREFLRRDDVRDREKAVVWNNLAFLLAAEGKQPEEALRFIEQAIEIMGPVPELLDTRGVALLAAGKPKEALADLNQAVQEAPSGVMYFHRALVHQALKDMRSAAADLQRAQENYQLTYEQIPKIERDSYNKLLAALKTP
ncbi:MAG TPA: tetratricopeptide repeat protein, partial [Thermoguttaceae bacterium]|nr:tetratricopeptide repeat protein [Thermoguttaceae bacterium]